MDELHRAVGCSHALLSLLQVPLTQYVAAYRQHTDRPTFSLEIQQQYANLSKAGARMQLQFIRDLWDEHFSMEMPPSALRDVKILLSVQIQSFYKASSSSTGFERGVAAAERLLVAVRASEDAIRQAQSFRNALAVRTYRERELAEFVPTDDTPAESKAMLRTTWTKDPASRKCHRRLRRKPAKSYARPRVSWRWRTLRRLSTGSTTSWPVRRRSPILMQVFTCCEHNASTNWASTLLLWTTPRQRWLWRRRLRKRTDGRVLRR